MSAPQQIRRDMLEIVRDEMIMKERLAEVLKTGPKTIPELSEAIGYPGYEVTIWLSAMLRYSEVEAIGRADVDGYFKYELVEKQSEAEIQG